jgi:phosphatidylglycerophosphatase C
MCANNGSIVTNYDNEECVPTTDLPLRGTTSPALSSPCIALFDLDGTLTWRDTLMPFLGGYLIRHPSRFVRLWRVPWAMLHYALEPDRGELKSRVVRAVMGGDSLADIDAWADAFVNAMQRDRRFRPRALACLQAHHAAGDHVILLSASPDLYVPRVGSLLQAEKSLCTELTRRNGRLEGTLHTPNRRGAEKSRCLAWLRQQYPGLSVVAYGNSASDLPHLALADRALLVNATAAARRQAAALGIAVAQWD